MTAVETLREAARLMRERAEAAMPGPWLANSHSAVVAPGGSYVTGALDEGDAAHIASWHPTVALAVADWLDSVAVSYALMPHSPRTGQALAVARAYLGETS